MGSDNESRELSIGESSNSSEREAVGYCRPPESTRFKKGQSGNPKGRPKGSLNVAAVLTRTLREKVVINENGRRKTVTKLEAAVKQLANKAASGELRALRQLVDLALECEADQNTPGAEQAVLGKADREVIQSIVERFQGKKNAEQEQAKAKELEE